MDAPLANPKNRILALAQLEIIYPLSGCLNFITFIQHNLILSTSQMEKFNFIPLSQPKLNFILLSRKSAVGQIWVVCCNAGVQKLF